MYIVHTPTLRPKGAQKPSNLHSSPKCWHDISNTNIYIQLTYIPQMLAEYIQYKYIILKMYIPQGAQKLPNNTFIPLVLAWYIQYQYI